MRTHYDTLGLKWGASVEDVKAAYRRLAREEHPDVSSRPDAQDRFRAIQEAYEVLTDDRRKTAYDAILNKNSEAEKERRRRQKEREEEERLMRLAEERMRDQAPRTHIDQEAVRHVTALVNQGRFIEAEQEALKMLQQESRQPVPYAVLGDVARYRGNLKKALENYGYAAQYEPANPIYQRKYEEVMVALNDPAANYRPTLTDLPEVNAAPLVVSIGLVLGAAIYTFFAQDQALRLPLVTEWTASVIAMLPVAGVVLGAGLAASGAIAKYRAVSGSATMTLPPAVALALLSLVSYWLAAAVYFVVGTRQQTFNRSLSLLLGAVGAVTVLFGLFGMFRSGTLGMQNLVFGGNLVYIGSLVGWLIGDALRRI
ncbi:MAG: J domain-containing protein [Fimbriimonadaceae bacterium]|nr:J domain-containing protein [Fimbriimonadaceae bacterium]QYK56276.1 MAG: J domain-containing protein [Fimbriimonadaceae bacterium]